MERVITRVLSHTRLVMLSKHECVYLEVQGIIYIKDPPGDTWLVFNTHIRPGVSL